MASITDLLLHGLLPLALFLWLLSAVLRRTPRASDGTQPTPKLRGNGRFSVEVVGESYYRPALRALHPIDGRRRRDHAVAVLRLANDNAHDDQAVAVYLNGRHIGHLSRSMARDFRAAIQRDTLTKYHAFAVDAQVVVPASEDLDHSVWLDLPEA